MSSIPTTTQGSQTSGMVSEDRWSPSELGRQGPLEGRLEMGWGPPRWAGNCRERVLSAAVTVPTWATEHPLLIISR